MSSTDSTKFVFASDLHGDRRLYLELLDLARSSSAQILGLGGDLFPSFSSTRRYEDMIPNQRTFIVSFLLPYFRRMTEESPVERIMLIPGNWDLGYPLLFEHPMEEMIDLSQKGYRLKNGCELIGYPYVPPTPFRPKDYEKRDDPESPWPPQKNPSYIRSPEHRDRLLPVDPSRFLGGRETIRDDLDGLPAPSSLKKTIYIMHSPPFGTRLDLIRGGIPAGSRSIKTFIEKHQPLLTLHGHIHESPEISGSYADWIGESLAINPGQSSQAGKEGAGLDAVTFEIERPWETLVHTRLPRTGGSDK